MNINELFQIASQKKASDLHLIVGKPPIIRVDGELKIIPDMPVIKKTDMEALVLSIITDAQKEKFLKERELDVSYELEGFSRYRINLHFEKDNMGLVARVISNVIPTMEELELPPVAFDLIAKPQGLILITGPTGCGKSTTLAAMVQRINDNRFANIITLEDPIEYIYTPSKSIIKQRQLGTDMNSFGNALKHVLRQYPNETALQFDIQSLIDPLDATFPKSYYICFNGRRRIREKVTR
jgi:twitching motility protein PilT